MRKTAKFVVPAAVKLPNGCVHTPQPEGYMQWHSWAEQAGKTHAQIKCEQCGRWQIWLPKSEARKINKRRLAEMNAFLESQNLPPIKASEY